MAKLLEHEERKWLSGLPGKPGETVAAESAPALSHSSNS